MDKKKLLVIFLIVFIDLVGFGIVIPILPYYSQTFGAKGTELGWLMSSYSLMQFLIAPIWGVVSDRVGRRPILLISMLGASASMCLMGFAQSLIWLFVARLLAGTFGANISTAYAYIADITDDSNRAKGMGVIGAGFGLGFIFGPAIGGILSQWGYSVPMFAGAIISLFNFVLAFFILKEPNLSEEERSAHRTRKFDWNALKITMGNRKTAIISLVFFLVTTAIAQMETTFALFLKAHFRMDAKQAGYLLALSGIIMVIVQGGLIGRLSKRFGERSLIFTGLAMTAFALWFFGDTVHFYVLLACLIVLSLGNSLLHPSLSSSMSKASDKNVYGATMGIFHSASSLARVVGPPIAGITYDSVHSAPFQIGSVLLIGAIVLFSFFPRPQVNT